MFRYAESWSKRNKKGSVGISRRGSGILHFFLIHPRRHRQDIGALVVYDVDVIHHVYEILKVAFGKGGEAFVPCAENQDVEPLDEQADEGDDPVDPDDDCNQDPVDDADEQLKTACIVHVREELGWGRVCSFGHNYHHAPLALPLIK